LQVISKRGTLGFVDSRFRSTGRIMSMVRTDVPWE